MKIGIDLGTANVLVYVKGKGVVITEPSVVAVSDDNRIVAVGEEAREMIGRTPGNIQAIRPMKDGVIADYVITEAMLRFFIAKATKGRIGISRPEVMISVPAGVTSVEKRAVRDAALKAGAKEAYLIEEPLAAAIGANVPISGPSGNMVIDIGGGTSEIAVIALGGIVVSTSLRVGGNKFDEHIATYIRKKYNLMVGERTAEEVKIAIGTALPLERELQMDVRGRDLIAGLPRTIPITSSEVMEAIEAPAAAARRRDQERPRADAARAQLRHHRQGHGDVRRRFDAAKHRQAADPGDRRPVPRRREPAELRGAGDGARPRALRLLQEVPGLDGLAVTPGGGHRAFVDLHVHTSASFDSLASPESVVRTAASRGLTHLAITDHDTIDGALLARDYAAREGIEITILVGQEVKTSDGDLIAVFLDRPIETGLSPAEAIAAIREQGGLVGIPHPFDRFRGSLLAGSDAGGAGDAAPADAGPAALAPLVDWVEAHNARIMVGRGNEQATAFAREHELPGVAVSDSHSTLEIGVAYSVIDGDPSTPDGLLAALPPIHLVTGRATYFVRAVTPVAKLVQRARGRGRHATTRGTKVAP